MLIKSADDKAKRIALLEDLQRSPLVDRWQQDWLRDELHRMRRGIAGERDAAHYLNNYLKDDPDRAVLHDLRFSVDGDVVQIDHLVITRGLFVYLLETKNFNGNLHINAMGEFSVEYAGERMLGIPSPLEQSRRHEGPLKKIFNNLEIKGRNGGAPRIEHCVLVHPSSNIHRPPAKALDTSNVIKADQFRSWHERFVEQNQGLGVMLNALLNTRSSDTLKEFANKLARQHRPADLLALPEFMQPRKAKVPPVPLLSVMPAVPALHSATTHTGKPAAAPKAAAVATNPGPALAVPAAEKRKLICATCGTKISFAEGKFCWGNERRFGGFQYCREHQAAMP